VPSGSHGGSSLEAVISKIRGSLRDSATDWLEEGRSILGQLNTETDLIIILRIPQQCDNATLINMLIMDQTVSICITAILGKLCFKHRPERSYRTGSTRCVLLRVHLHTQLETVMLGQSWLYGSAPSVVHSGAGDEGVRQNTHLPPPPPLNF
jgi:hypothetical protein